MPPTKNKASGILAAAQLVAEALAENPLSENTIENVIKILKKNNLKVSITNLARLRLYSKFSIEEKQLIESRGHDPEFYESMVALPSDMRVKLTERLVASRLTAQNAKIMLTLLHRLYNTDSAAARGILEKIPAPINPKRASSLITQELEKFT